MTRSQRDSGPLAYWLIQRDDVPFALLVWDTDNESCPPSTPQNEHLTRLDYHKFDLLSAFEAYPVMTMDEYTESIVERGEIDADLRKGTILCYGNVECTRY